MRPLRLNPDELQVQSFRTTASGGTAGTVWALDSNPPFNTVGDIPSCERCQASNQATCDTCQGPNCRGGAA